MHAPENGGSSVANADGVVKSAAEQYKEFRDDLLSFSLGEAAYDYAKRLRTEQPDNPALLALFGETAWMYEKVKNPTRRQHWVDRMEVLQEGIDATRKCMRENPDYGPCFRVYTLLTAKASEQKYWFKLVQPFGPIEHLDAIRRRGERAVELDPDSPDTLAALGQITARVATNTKRWWTPYTAYARYMGLPSYHELFEESLKYHLKVAELLPNDVENACRLGMLYFEMGNNERAKRWYLKTRDEIVNTDPTKDIYQSIAHTHLTIHVARNQTWNVPFG
jgi:tetratricopeptide (TPR) repeat protein